MSEFFPRIAKVLAKGTLYTGFAVASAGCDGAPAGPSTNPIHDAPANAGGEIVYEPTVAPEPTPTPVIYWFEGWTATYRHPVTGATETIPYTSITEFPVFTTTCPDFFEVTGGVQWELVDSTCTDVRVFSYDPRITSPQ